MAAEEPGDENAEEKDDDAERGDYDDHDRASSRVVPMSTTR